jgi:hypothetical protein
LHWFSKKAVDKLHTARQYYESTGIMEVVAESSALTAFFSSFAPVYRFCYIQFCGVVAASVDVERVWSQAGKIVTNQRNRLMDTKLTTELFVKFNKDVPTIPSKVPFHQPRLNISALFEDDVLLPIEPINLIEVDLANESEMEWSDEEMRGIAQEIEEEFTLADVDPFWSSSDASKHFGNSVKELLKQPGCLEQQMVTRTRKGIIICFFLIIIIILMNIYYY